MEDKTTSRYEKITLCVLLQPAFSELDYDNKRITLLRKYVDTKAFTCYIICGGRHKDKVLGEKTGGHFYLIPFPYSNAQGMGFALSYIMYLSVSFFFLLYLVLRHRIRVLVGLGGHVYTGLVISLVSKITHTKSIVRVAEMTMKETVITHRGGQLLSMALRPIEKFVFSCSDRIVTNRNVEELLEKGAEEKKIRVISQGVELHLFNPQATPRLLRSGFPKVIAVSRLTKEKNLIGLIHAIRTVKAVYPNCTLTIVGSGPEFRNLAAEVKSLNLEGNVFLKGRILHNEVPYELSGCDIFVLPSFYEGLPSSMLEAMACGLPVIATPVMERISGLRNEVNILIADPTPQKIAEAIIRLSSDKHLRQKIKTNGFEYVKRHHDAAKAKMVFSEVVNNLVKMK